MDPKDIPEITDFHDKDTNILVAPSRVDKYKLTGSTTRIAHAKLDIRSVVCKGNFSLESLKLWKSPPKCVNVREIKIEWHPHVELNHVAFMNVKIHNAYSTENRSRKNDLFLEGLFPINIHWAISVSSPRWITTEKYICYSPWSYTITARNIPQESLEKAGEMCLSYTIEKGHKHKESSWTAPLVVTDPVPFPYMIPFYKYRSPGGLYESNMSVIKSLIMSMRKALEIIGINKTIRDETIWALANTVNADMQMKITRMEAEEKGSALGILESIINLVNAEKSPGYPMYDSVLVLAKDSIHTMISREINSIGEELGSSSRVSHI